MRPRVTVNTTGLMHVQKIALPANNMDRGRAEYDSRPAKRQRRDCASSDSEHRSRHRSHRTKDEESHSQRRNGREERDVDRRRSHRRSRSPDQQEPTDSESARGRGGSNERRSRRSRRDNSSERHRDNDRSRSRSRSRSRERQRRSRHDDRKDEDDTYQSDERRRRTHHEGRHRRRQRHDDNHHHRHRHRSESASASASPQPHSRSKRPLPSQKDAFTSETTSNPDGALDKPLPNKQKANFGLTGKLAAASNTIQTGGQTIVLKYHEPPEARKPAARDAWRLYVFKGDEIVETVELGEQSCWLFGRETAVVDLPIEHPSCSKQHAVIQFRYIEKKNEFGDRIGRVKPYIIDLESANGTLVNDQRIPDAKYVELKDKDVVKFGHSTREYMIQLPPRP